MYCVYVHISPSNKLYIGITSNIKSRWATKGLQYSVNKAFYNAIKKYGWDNFKHIVFLDGRKELSI